MIILAQANRVTGVSSLLERQEVPMAVYYGVVKGNMVVLSDDAQLPDGTTVEVHTSGLSGDHTDQVMPEEEFMQRLVDEGLLTEVRRPDRTNDTKDRRLIQVEGQPLSEMIIEERR
jgi:hypothetical protein